MSLLLPLNVSLQKSRLSPCCHVWYLCLIFMAGLQSNTLIWWIIKQDIQKVYFQPIYQHVVLLKWWSCAGGSYRIALDDLEPIAVLNFVPLQTMNSAVYPIYVWRKKINSVIFLPLRCRSISIDWLEIFSIIRLLSTRSKLQASGGLDAAARFTRGLFLPRYKEHAGCGSLR